LARAEKTELINWHIERWLSKKPNTAHRREVGLLTAVPIPKRRVEGRYREKPFDRRADFLAWECWPGKLDVWTIVEVKSCLDDFRSDQKWRHYLQFCNKLYFAVLEDFPIEKINGFDFGIVVCPAQRKYPNARIVKRAKPSPTSELVDMNRMKFLLARRKIGQEAYEY